jgi:hypothetical protein
VFAGSAAMAGTLSAFDLSVFPSPGKARSRLEALAMGSR